MKTYMCLGVRFDGSKKIYNYLSDDLTIEKGDYVIVSATNDKVVQVVEVGVYTEEELPYPLEKLKKIKGLYKKKDDTHLERPTAGDLDDEDEEEVHIEKQTNASLKPERKACDNINCAAVYPKVPNDALSGEDEWASCAENNDYFAYVTRAGRVVIVQKAGGRQIFKPKVFNTYYRRYISEYELIPLIFFTPDSRYCIITCDIGNLFFVNLKSGTVEKEDHLFPEISYEKDDIDEVYKGIEFTGYYELHTVVQFSKSGRYAVIRIRGKYDPQSTDGWEPEECITPIYLRSVFLMDMKTNEIFIREYFDDVPEKKGRNVAAIAFSPNETKFAAGALGNVIKIFDLKNGKEIGRVADLCWKADPSDITDCRVIVFCDEDRFLFVNRSKNILVAEIDGSGSIDIQNIIETGIKKHDHREPDKGYDRWADINELEYKEGKIRCGFRMMNYSGSREFTCDLPNQPAELLESPKVKKRPQNAFVVYKDYKKKVEDAFRLLKDGELLSAYDVSEWLYDQIEEYGDGFSNLSAMFFIISVAEYEIRHNLLEDRIRNGASYHIYRYEKMGRYKPDLSEEEIEQVEKDMAYIKSKVKLPELNSYEDRDYN